MKSIDSGFRLALTGTPVENRLSELWSIFDYLMPGLLFSYKRFRREVEAPVINKKDESAMAELKKIITPFILRRLKKDVLRDLPDKIEENLVIVKLQERYEQYPSQSGGTDGAAGEQIKQISSYVAEVMRHTTISRLFNRQTGNMR